MSITIVMFFFKPTWLFLGATWNRNLSSMNTYSIDKKLFFQVITEYVYNLLTEKAGLEKIKIPVSVYVRFTVVFQ